MDGGEEERNLLTVATQHLLSIGGCPALLAEFCLTTRRFIRMAGSKNGAARGGQRVAKEQKINPICGWKSHEQREENKVFSFSAFVRGCARPVCYVVATLIPPLIALFLSWPSTVNSRINT